MIAFPPHLQLAFPVPSELAHTYGLRFRQSITLAFFVSLAVSSLSDSPAGDAFWPASSTQSDSTLLSSSAWCLALRACVTDAFRFRLLPCRRELTVCLRLALGIRRSSTIALPLISSPPVQLQLRSVSSHAGRTFTDIIVTLQLRSSAVRSISDAILASDPNRQSFVRVRLTFNTGSHGFLSTLWLPLAICFAFAFFRQKSSRYTHHHSHL
jgi:hypothetical protein